MGERGGETLCLCVSAHAGGWEQGREQGRADTEEQHSRCMVGNVFGGGGVMGCRHGFAVAHARARAWVGGGVGGFRVAHSIRGGLLQRIGAMWEGEGKCRQCAPVRGGLQLWLAMCGMAVW